MQQETKIVYLDLETTGLNHTGTDEILQIAIIDDAENTLLYSYCKPISKTEWQDAERIHHISPEDVKDAPTLIELMPQIILAIRDKTVVIYNVDFDCSFIPNLIKYATKTVCCMLEFARYYNIYDSYRHSYRWQKLSTASRYVGYDLNNAHDALADCKATRAVYNYLISFKNRFEIIEKKEFNKLHLGIEHEIIIDKDKKIPFNYQLFRTSNALNENHQYEYIMQEDFNSDDKKYSRLIDTLLGDGLLDNTYKGLFNFDLADADSFYHDYIQSPVHCLEFMKFVKYNHPAGTKSTAKKEVLESDFKLNEFKCDWIATSVKFIILDKETNEKLNLEYYLDLEENKYFMCNNNLDSKQNSMLEYALSDLI